MTNKVWIIVCFIYSWGYEVHHSINMSTFLSTFEIWIWYFELILQANQSFERNIFIMKFERLFEASFMSQIRHTSRWNLKLSNFIAFSTVAWKRSKSEMNVALSRRVTILEMQQKPVTGPNANHIGKWALRDRIFETIVNAHLPVRKRMSSSHVREKTRIYFKISKHRVPSLWGKITTDMCMRSGKA